MNFETVDEYIARQALDEYIACQASKEYILTKHQVKPETHNFEPGEIEELNNHSH